VVHLHWINGLVKLGTLRNVRKPLVWTLRDMWPLTGGCHYALECDRYRVGCGACPQLGSTSRNDLSRLVAHRKAGAIPAHAKLVGISDWLSDCARESAVTRHLSIRTISNNIDVRQFAPIEKATARRILGLPVDRRLVLLGAHAVGDFYKGFDLAKAALQGLRRDDVQLVFFGTASPSILEGIGHPTSSLGFLTDAVALRLAYSAADVFVAPSRMDAFGKTIGEAMACGTPAVCFDATGPRDIVEHRVSGWLARPFEVADLARGIEWVLDRPEADYARLCADARVRVVERFDTRVIARQYVALYDEALGAHA
jgi:glycosyltransferase involved in cell wall biosynthesis